MPTVCVYHLEEFTAYDVPTPGFNWNPVPAYVARPQRPCSYPGLLRSHGVHGHEEHMKDVARRFAVLGYVCIVPALYSRDGFLTVVEEEDMARAGAALAIRPHAQTIGDLAGAHEFLRKSPYVGDRVGLVGFCSGGRTALIYACKRQGLSPFVNF